LSFGHLQSKWIQQYWFIYNSMTVKTLSNSIRPEKQLSFHLARAQRQFFGVFCLESGGHPHKKAVSSTRKPGHTDEREDG
jgi:hypothetical protein